MDGVHTLGAGVDIEAVAWLVAAGVEPSDERGGLPYGDGDAPGGEKLGVTGAGAEAPVAGGGDGVRRADLSTLVRPRAFQGDESSSG